MDAFECRSTYRSRGRWLVVFLAIVNSVFLVRAVQDLSTWPNSVTVTLPGDKIQAIEQVGTGADYAVEVRCSDILFGAMQARRLDFLGTASISLLMLAAIAYLAFRDSRIESVALRREVSRSEVKPGDLKIETAIPQNRHLSWQQHVLRVLLLLVFLGGVAASFWTVRIQRERAREAWLHDDRYTKVPLLNPLSQGGCKQEPEWPTEDEVRRALEVDFPLSDDWPFSYTERINVRMETDVFEDKIEPPMVRPLIGPTQAHHIRYRCKVRFTDAKRVAAPISFTTSVNDRYGIYYFDHDHFHLFQGDVQQR
jgi:hypothetical protein